MPPRLTKTSSLVREAARAPFRCREDRTVPGMSAHAASAASPPSFSHLGGTYGLGQRSRPEWEGLVMGRRRLRRRLRNGRERPGRNRIDRPAPKKRKQGGRTTRRRPRRLRSRAAGALRSLSPPTALRPHAPCPMPVAPPWTPVPPTNQAILTRLRELIGDTMYGHIPSSNC